VLTADKIFTIPFDDSSFKLLPNMFPHKIRRPLVNGEESIKHSNHVVLSIGGNNFREF